MAFGLTIGTERSTALQNSIQDELTTRGYSPDADPVMAEYITIMIINNKTPAQISAELQELIGPDFDPTFVDWLFQEAAKGSPESEVAPPPPIPAAPATPIVSVASPAPSNAAPQNPLSAPPSLPLDNRRRSAPGPGLYQQALSSALPTAGAKRTRSPSPGSHANKARRISDLPTGPRAMQAGGPPGGASGPGGRSLLERMSGRYAKDDIQARIDNITAAGEGFPHNGAPLNGPMNMNGLPMNMGMPPMPPMDMNMMQAQMPMANPLMLQEMMMNQMALMAQMAGAIGILGPQFPGGEVPNGDQRGRGMGMRGRGRGGSSRAGGGGGRGGHAPAPPLSTSVSLSTEGAAPSESPAPAHAPVQMSAPQPTYPRPPHPHNVTAPMRPLSPTLCKFGWKCTNTQCRWSHPSPVATAESGVVLSNEACEKGVRCADKDCVKAHVSPAAARLADGAPLAPPSIPPPTSTSTPPTTTAPPPSNTTPTALNPSAPPFTPPAGVPCRYGLACTRPGCTYTHPPGHPLHRPSPYSHYGQKQTSSTPCRFGAGCTRAGCPFVHPEGRGVLPGTFHRGLGLDVPLGNEGAGKNRSMTFNKAKTAGKDGVVVAKEKENGVDAVKEEDKAKDTAAELEKRVKEVEEMKIAVQSALREKEEARKRVVDGVSAGTNGNGA